MVRNALTFGSSWNTSRVVMPGQPISSCRPASAAWQPPWPKVWEIGSPRRDHCRPGARDRACRSCGAGLRGSCPHWRRPGDHRGNAVLRRGQPPALAVLRRHGVQAIAVPESMLGEATAVLPATFLNEAIRNHPLCRRTPSIRSRPASPVSRSRSPKAAAYQRSILTFQERWRCREGTEFVRLLLAVAAVPVWTTSQLSGQLGGCHRRLTRRGGAWERPETSPCGRRANLAKVQLA
jgi:hypothetical protein